MGRAFTGENRDVELLDVHADPDHHRAVFTLAGDPGSLAPALLHGAREAIARIDLRRHAGVHPHVGALDVAPVVHLTPGERGAACAEALVAGDLIGSQLCVPVLLYGVLARGRTRAQLRRGGPAELARRLAEGELAPDFGPSRAHPSAGITLLGARPPLVAFNLLLPATVTLDAARGIAARLREGGPEGLPGVRALGLKLPGRDAVQLSFNVEDPDTTPLGELVAAVRRHVEPRRAELVGLAPKRAFVDFPDDLPIPGFDPERHILERRLGLH